jgi:hypothetical protein
VILPRSGRGYSRRPVMLPIGPGISPTPPADDFPDGPMVFPMGPGDFPDRAGNIPAGRGDIPDGSEDKGVKGTFLISGGNIFQAGRGYPRVSLAPGTHISHKSLPWTGTWQP